jgi:hypothetical protein
MQKAKQDNNKELDGTSSTIIGYTITMCQSIGDQIKVEQ